MAKQMKCWAVLDTAVECLEAKHVSTDFSVVGVYGSETEAQKVADELSEANFRDCSLHWFQVQETTFEP